MSKRTKRWAVLFLAAELVLSGAAVSLGVPASTAYAATTFRMTVTPGMNEKGVGLSTPLRLSFDRVVTPQTGMITVTAAGSHNPLHSIPIGSSGLVGSSNQFEVRLPSAPALSSNTTYSVSVPEGLFRDANGNESYAYEWSFTTAPEIDRSLNAGAFQPAPGSRINSTGTQNLSFEINALVKPNNGFVKLINAATNETVRTFNISERETAISVEPNVAGGKTTITLPLGMNLNAGSNYYVLIDEYAFARIDNGQVFGGISSGSVWSFSTVASGAARVTVTPATGSSSVSPAATLQMQFDRPMYPASGSIVVSPGTVNDSRAKIINVNSTQVTGGGTNTISIAAGTASSPLLSGTTYTATVPAGAFFDQDGHPFPANGSTYSWTFTTAAGTGAPTATLYPLDGSSSFSVNDTMRITFNRDVTYSNPAGDGVLLYKQGGARVNAKVTQTSSRVFSIKPTAALDPDATYYIDIKNNVFADASNPQLFYAGLSGSSRWTFRTTAIDRTPPVIQSAIMSDSRVIQLKYNEALNSGVNLLTSSFPVTVNGETRTVDNVVVSGDTVYVYLSTGVAVGQVVRISYSGGLRTIQDISGNNAATFSSRTVTNDIVSVLNGPREGSISGRSLSLTFNESLASVSPYAYGQFSVMADGYSLGVSSISSSGSTVYLNLASTAPSGAVVKVGYYAGSYPLQNFAGQQISAFQDFFVRNTSDTVPPVLQSVTGSGTQVVLTYNEGLRTDNLPMNSQFSVLSGGTSIFINDVSAKGNQVTLTLQSALPANGNVTLSYVTGTRSISDLNYNRAASVSLQPITLTASSTVSGISNAYVNGTDLTLNFNQTMSSSYVPYTNQFTVLANNNTVNVQNVQWSGNMLRLTLANPVTGGQTVQLSYTSGNGSLRTSSGTVIPSFSGLNVQNAAGSGSSAGAGTLSSIPSGEFGRPLSVLKQASATATTDTSVFNRSIKKYSLDADRVTAAFEQISRQGESALAFEVPSTEAAAYVSVPLRALGEAARRDGNAEFIIYYGDQMLGLKAKDLDLAGLGGNASVSQTTLLFRMERVPAGSYSAQESALTSRGLRSVTPLTDIQLLSSVNGGTGAKLAEVPLQYTIRTTSSLNTDQVALNRVDLQYTDASYLPTAFTNAGSYTVLSAPVTGADLVGGYLSMRTFSDMGSHWARSAVNELTSKNIIDNSYGTSFRPGTATTRAEFAVMLSRGLGLTGSPETAQRFRDVQANTQTGAYIGAAAKAGIITGNTDGTFRPNDLVTREQMAIMMVRALEYTGNPVTLNGTPASVLASYKDRNLVQATEQVAKAITGGIVNGVSTGVFDPRGNATRAQAAIMLQRMLKHADYL